jgi:hypothetical protein
MFDSRAVGHHASAEGSPVLRLHRMDSDQDITWASHESRHDSQPRNGSDNVAHGTDPAPARPRHVPRAGKEAAQLLGRPLLAPHTESGTCTRGCRTLCTGSARSIPPVRCSACTASLPFARATPSSFPRPEKRLRRVARAQHHPDASSCHGHTVVLCSPQHHNHGTM